MMRVCRDRRNHRVFRLGGGGGGSEGGGELVAFCTPAGGVVGGVEAAPPEVGGIGVGVELWTLSCGGFGGTKGIFWGGAVDSVSIAATG